MPTYDYLCQRCGPFSEIRAMADYAEPAICEGCGLSAPRAMLVAPSMSALSSATRVAHATNERSANAPASSRSHPSGCGCCKGSVAAKSKAATRPWMISH